MNNEDLIRRIEKLERWRKNMSASFSFPLENDRAIRERLNIGSALKNSTKSATSETVTVISSVNFGAQTTTSAGVLDDPDQFVETEINGVTLYIPAFT